MTVPDRNLAVELVRVTEAAALAAARWIGRRVSPSENVGRVAEAKKKTAREVAVVVLNRARHDDLIAELRDVGARVNLIPHGDTAPAIAAARVRSGVDMVMGIGGTTEGV